MWHWQLSGRLEGVWANDEALKKAVKGARYRQGLAETPKVGAIDESMMQALVHRIEVANPAMALVVRVSFGCAARIKGILALRPSRVKMADGGVWVLVPNKGYKASSVEKTEPLVWQKLFGEVGKLIVDKAKDRPGDELLFPVSEWRLGQLRRVVWESARDLGWPDDLQFRVHSLRHGGLQWLLGNGAAEEELPVMGPGVRKRYAETNDSRRGRGETGSEMEFKKKRLEKA